MARGVNKVILVGTCGQDPETRYLPNGNAVTNLSLATSEQWTDKQSGQKVEKTEWHRVSLFGKVAEIAGEYLRKGAQVYIEGKLQTREWEKDGIKRYTTEIVVDMQGAMQLALKTISRGSAERTNVRNNNGHSRLPSRPSRHLHQMMTGWTQTFRSDQHHGPSPSQVPRSRLGGTASPFRRTEARAKRTLDETPVKKAHRRSVGLLHPHAPEVHAAVGEMTRAAPLVFQ